MTRSFPQHSFVVSGISLAAVALALTLGVSGAQAAAGGNAWWEYGHVGGYAAAVAIQPNGKIVVAGYGTDDFALARYTKGGTLDTSFGVGGKVFTDIGSSTEDYATAVAIQPNGKIVVAGYSKAQGTDDFALARYTKGGTLDTSFGVGGKVLTDIGSSTEDYATAVAIQPNGAIVVAGYSNAAGTNDFALARYTTGGTLDTSFGAGGKVLTNFGSSSSDEGTSIALQPNGKIVVVGRFNRPKIHKFALARYTTSGTLDTSFGRGGRVLAGFRSTSWSGVEDVALQKNGKIVAVGTTRQGKSLYFALARYTHRGQLDPRFGTGGRALTGFGSAHPDPVGLAVALQADGRIVAAGYSTFTNAARECDWDPTSITLARYTMRGTLDQSFGKRGRVDRHFSDGGSTLECGDEGAYAVAIAPNGRIVTAGGVGGGFLVASYFGR